MGDFYSDILQIADDVTGEVIPSLAVVPQQITIITRTWSGGSRDLGTPSDQALPLPKKFWIRELKTAEVANEAGRYEAGDIEVSGIVPNHPANGPAQGFTEAQLAPVVTSDGVEIIYRIVSSGGGAHAGDYMRVWMDTADSFSWRLILRRLRTTPIIGMLAP